MPPIGRPQAVEYPPYYISYISLIEGEDPLPALEAQVAAFQSLAGLPEERAGHRYADGKWTVREVLGHVMDGERICGYRAMRIARGDQTPLPGFVSHLYAETAGHDACPLAELVEELVFLRRSHVLLFRHLPPEAWTRQGVINEIPASTRGLAFFMAGHAAHHLAVLRDRYGINFLP